MKNEKLINAIKEAGISNNELSIVVKVDRTTIWRMINNAHKPRRITIKRVCRALGKNAIELGLA